MSADSIRAGKLQTWQNKMTGERWKAYPIRLEFQVSRGTIISAICESRVVYGNDEWPKTRNGVFELAREFVGRHGTQEWYGDDVTDSDWQAAEKIVNALFPEL